MLYYPLRQRLDLHALPVEKDLRWFTNQLLWYVVTNSPEARHRNQLGFQAVAENPRFDVTRDTGHGAPAQVAIDMNVTIRQQLGARADGAEDYEVTLVSVDLLARANRMRDQPRVLTGSN